MTADYDHLQNPVEIDLLEVSNFSPFSLSMIVPYQYNPIVALTF
jgi:hypothetical protein